MDALPHDFATSHLLPPVVTAHAAGELLKGVVIFLHRFADRRESSRVNHIVTSTSETACSNANESPLQSGSILERAQASMASALYRHLRKSQMASANA